MEVKNLEDVLKVLKSTGFPVAYHHFDSANCPAPPYICYFCDGENSFFADGQIYAATLEISIAVYTVLKEPKTEGTLEQALKSGGITYAKQCYYIENEQIYETIYKTEV